MQTLLLCECPLFFLSSCGVAAVCAAWCIYVVRGRCRYTVCRDHVRVQLLKRVVLLLLRVIVELLKITSRSQLVNGPRPILLRRVCALLAAGGRLEQLTTDLIGNLQGVPRNRKNNQKAQAAPCDSTTCLVVVVELEKCFQSLLLLHGDLELVSLSVHQKCLVPEHW